MQKFNTVLFNYKHDISQPKIRNQIFFTNDHWERAALFPPNLLRF